MIALGHGDIVKLVRQVEFSAQALKATLTARTDFAGLPRFFNPVCSALTISVGDHAWTFFLRRSASRFFNASRAV